MKINVEKNETLIIVVSVIVCVQKLGQLMSQIYIQFWPEKNFTHLDIFSKCRQI